MLAPGFIQQMQTTCDVCSGKGKIIKSTCSVCAGKKVKRGGVEVTVSIEKGMADGQTINLERQADESPDHSAGDLIFTIQTQPHPVYSRKGDNLYAKETITLKEALLGFTKTLTHLDGTTFEVKRSTVTQPGMVDPC